MGDKPDPGPPPEARQFDFWLGDWKVTWGENGRGVNRVESILDGYVILENFDAAPAMPFRGLSVSTFNRWLGKWQQTWVDNQGNYLDFIGEYDSGSMILQRETTLDGVTFLQRMVWHNIASNRLDWNWERSDDRGRTWDVVWHIHYERVTDRSR